MLDRYERPYDLAQPVVGFDERPCPWLAETRAPLPFPLLPGRPARDDYTYRRRGSANGFGYREPLRGGRHLEVITRRTQRDCAPWMRRLVDEFYPRAELIPVGVEVLQHDTQAALDETFPAPLAQRLARKRVFHDTPLPGSCRTAVAIEFAALSKQGLDRRSGDRTTLAQEGAAWEGARNATAGQGDWPFRTADARIQLQRLYPIFAH